MNGSGFDLGPWIVAWLAVAAVLVMVQLRVRASGVGLVIAYLLGLAIIHVPAALLYTLPGYFNNDPAVVQLGFEQSAYAVIAFGLGALLVGPLLKKYSDSRVEKFASPRVNAAEQRIPMLLVGLGLFSYLVVTPVIGAVPTLTALVAVANQLMLVGLCLGGWQAWQHNRRVQFVGWLCLGLTLPLLTTLTQGFLGYGGLAALTVLIFVGTYMRPRWVVLLIGITIGYVGLSVFVTYFRDRDAIRSAVWGALPLDQRVAQINLTLTYFEWFDVNNPQHLQFVDGRLNQNLLVGAAVQYLGARYIDYATGDTLIQAALALVPRVFWPDKPVFAGSPGLVSAFTGIQFAPGTSVGIGQVLEFYINFGTPGVVAGFLIFGSLLAFVDRLAAGHLLHGRWGDFAFWYLVGLGFLQSGGSLVEIVGTVGASMVTGFLVMRYLVPIFLRRDSTPRPRPMLAGPGR